MFLSRGILERKVAHAVLAILWLASLFTAGAAANAQEQNACATQLKQADQKIYDGLFDEALELVDQCLLQPNLADSTKARALRPKALAYEGKNYVAQARDTIRELLRLAPDYEADQVQDPPSFRELVEQVRKEVQSPPPEPAPSQKRGGVMKWILLGGGAAGVAAIAAIALNNGGGNGMEPPANRLPDPPPLP